MVEIDANSFKKAADELRDILNWIAVFEEEYSLPAEVVSQLKDRLEKVATLLGAGTIQ